MVPQILIMPRGSPGSQNAPWHPMFLKFQGRVQRSEEQRVAIQVACRQVPWYQILSLQARLQESEDQRGALLVSCNRVP